MKIFRMIFHIALMAIVVFVLGYCLGLPIQKTEPDVERKLGRRQQVVHYKGTSKEITDQYIEKHLVPIDDKIDYDSIVYYNEEEILYNGEGYELGRNGSQYMMYSMPVVHYTLSHLVEAYPDPILRDCGNGYYYAMYHTEYNNRLYVFMTTEESNHNHYMETIGYPIVMTEKLSYSDFCGIKKHDSIDRVAEVDSVIDLYKNCREMPTTTVHLLTDGILQINYRVKYGEYLVDELIYDEDYFGIYKVYKQDYVPKRKSQKDDRMKYTSLWCFGEDQNGFNVEETSFSKSWQCDDVYIEMIKQTAGILEDVYSDINNTNINGSIYYFDDKDYCWDDTDGSGTTYERRVYTTMGKFRYIMCARTDNKESLDKVPLDKLIDLMYNHENNIDGLEKCGETWHVLMSDGVISERIYLDVAPYGKKKYQELKNNDSLELVREKGIEYYVSKRQQTNVEPSAKTLYYNSGIGLITIKATVPYDARNDVPENALDFVNIDLAKEIVDYITR